jgi:hypothetical protein
VLKSSVKNPQSGGTDQHQVLAPTSYESACVKNEGQFDLVFLLDRQAVEGAHASADSTCISKYTTYGVVEGVGVNRSATHPLAVFGRAISTAGDVHRLLNISTSRGLPSPNL